MCTTSLLLLLMSCGELGRPSDFDKDHYTVEDGDLCDADASRNPGIPESPDGIDNNCDGRIDESTVWSDDDGDGYCEEGDASGMCIGDAIPGDCDDGNALSYPGAVEAADGQDNNCDGLVDEGLACTDDDGDGYVDGDDCANGIGGDCNDLDATISPGALETCNDVDDNCDGEIDEGYDLDEDGWTECDGDWADTDPMTYPNAEEICDNIDNDGDGNVDEGYDADFDGVTDCEGDCAPDDPTIYLGADEVCDDGVDNDCDGRTDDDDNDSGDDDSDGFGLCADCDPNDRTVYPGATETLNGIDDNCDGQIDEGLDPDEDGDGFPLSSDCDDTDPAVNPDAVEEYDGVDQNCDGAVDETYETYTLLIPTIYNLAPTLVYGDAEFSGHGPTVEIAVALTIAGDLVVLTIQGSWTETKSDWTTGELAYSDTVYAGGMGCSIDSMTDAEGTSSSSSLSESFSYTDSNHAADDLGGAGFVDHLWTHGDTDDDDIGDGTDIQELGFGVVTLVINCP